MLEILDSEGHEKISTSLKHQEEFGDYINAFLSVTSWGYFAKSKSGYSPNHSITNKCSRTFFNDLQLLSGEVHNQNKGSYFGLEGNSNYLRLPTRDSALTREEMKKLDTKIFFNKHAIFPLGSLTRDVEYVDQDQHDFSVKPMKVQLEASPNVMALFVHKDIFKFKQGDKEDRACPGYMCGPAFNHRHGIKRQDMLQTVLGFTNTEIGAVRYSAIPYGVVLKTDAEKIDVHYPLIQQIPHCPHMHSCEEAYAVPMKSDDVLKLFDELLGLNITDVKVLLSEKGFSIWDSPNHGALLLSLALPLLDKKYQGLGCCEVWEELLHDLYAIVCNRGTGFTLPKSFCDAQTRTLVFLYFSHLYPGIKLAFLDGQKRMTAVVHGLAQINFYNDVMPRMTFVDYNILFPIKETGERFLTNTKVPSGLVLYTAGNATKFTKREVDFFHQLSYLEQEIYTTAMATSVTDWVVNLIEHELKPLNSIFIKRCNDETSSRLSVMFPEWQNYSARLTNLSFPDDDSQVFKEPLSIPDISKYCDHYQKEVEGKKKNKEDDHQIALNSPGRCFEEWNLSCLERTLFVLAKLFIKDNGACKLFLQNGMPALESSLEKNVPVDVQKNEEQTKLLWIVHLWNNFSREARKHDSSLDVVIHGPMKFKGIHNLVRLLVFSSFHCKPSEIDGDHPALETLKKLISNNGLGENDPPENTFLKDGKIYAPISYWEKKVFFPTVVSLPHTNITFYKSDNGVPNPVFSGFILSQEQFQAALYGVCHVGFIFDQDHQHTLSPIGQIRWLCKIQQQVRCSF